MIDKTIKNTKKILTAKISKKKKTLHGFGEGTYIENSSIIFFFFFFFFFVFPIYVRARYKKWI